MSPLRLAEDVVVIEGVPACEAKHEVEELAVQATLTILDWPRVAPGAFEPGPPAAPSGGRRGAC